MRLRPFRRLWLGQIFSQLDDKFYIILTVSLTAGHWVSAGAGPTIESGGALADAASAMQLRYRNESPGDHAPGHGYPGIYAAHRARDSPGGGRLVKPLAQAQRNGGLERAACPVDPGDPDRAV